MIPLGRPLGRGIVIRSLVVAAAIASVILVTGAAVSLISPQSSAGHAASPAMGAGAHDWHGGTGTIPTQMDGLLHMEHRATISIQNDSQFNPANGVRSGTGTFEDPFVISDWSVDTVLIKDTSRAFEFKENRVNTILILDWTGQGGYVHHNHIEDLRTNRNVARMGDASATVIENNEITRVEELRHFDGEVRANTIGRTDPVSVLGSLLPENGVVFNIAGLDGAGIHDNLVYGGVDMKLHGHNHSDHEGGASHNHSEADTCDSAALPHDHKTRYVDFEFYNNHIIDDKFGLRYNDLNHAGDDRTATSEREPALDLPHVHHTRVNIHDNVIDGSGLTLDVVNAADDRHLPGESAYVELANNAILKPSRGSGILVEAVRDATIHIHGNRVERSVTGGSSAAAILLVGFENSTLTIDHNDLGADGYGIRASNFDSSTRWLVGLGNVGNNAHRTYWDSSVANPPETADAQTHQEAGSPGASSLDAGTASLPFDVRNTGLK